MRQKSEANEQFMQQSTEQLMIMNYGIAQSHNNILKLLGSRLTITLLFAPLLTFRLILKSYLCHAVVEQNF